MNDLISGINNLVNRTIEAVDRTVSAVQNGGTYYTKEDRKEWAVRLVRYVPTLEDPDIGRYYRTTLLFYYEPTREMIDQRLMDVFGYTADEVKRIFVERVDVRDITGYHRYVR